MDDQQSGGLDLSLDDIRAVTTVDGLAAVLRRLRRREARLRGASPLSYRELAAKTGWAHGIIGDYFSGQALAPTDRFDILVGLLGATAKEQGALATARDRVEEGRRRARGAAPERPGAPRQMPAPASGFVGRIEAQKIMDGLIMGAGDDPGARIVALCGTAGVGKTALGLHWAHRWAGRFPDGSLYIDLHGFGPAQPSTAAEALTGFLRGLGVPGAKLATEPDQLATQFRTLIADRRMIIFLDNALSAQQVRPLLPGTGSSLIIVTSRDQLAGLVARDGATRVGLDLLTRDEAMTLLRHLIGARVNEEPDAALALADRCARLPLALRVAAELAVRRPTAGIADLVKELDAEPRPLDLLEAGGDPDTAIRPILSWSYQSLSPPAAWCFRALGHFSGTDLGVPAVAALAGTGVPEAQTHLDELVRTHLAELRGPGRYGTHDLLRAYAVERLAAHPEQSAQSALDRLEDYFLLGCREAVAALYPAETTDTVPALAAAEALRWLDTELVNVVALSRQGRSGFAAELSACLWNYLDRNARYPEALVIHGNAIAAAQDGQDPAAEAAALGELGQTLIRMGRYNEALERLHRALRLGESTRQAAILNSLSIAYSRLGDTGKALEYLHMALSSHRAQGNRVGEGKVLSNLGIEYAQMGRFTAAVEHFEQALVIAVELGDHYGRANALNNLGLVTCWLGRFEAAVRFHDLGLELARQIGDRAGEGRLLANLGVSHTGLGALDRAGDLLAEATRIHVEVGDRAAHAEALTYLGDLWQARGDFAAALNSHEEALAVAIEIGYRHVQAPAHNGAGRALSETGRIADAQTRFEAALAVARDIGDRLQEAHALSGLAQCGGGFDVARRARAIYIDLGIQ